MDAKRFREEYKYITYFLKEIGLFLHWKEYLEEETRRGKNDVYSPSRYRRIDDVFGTSAFTLFLRRRKITLISASVSLWFRAFLEVYAPHIKRSGDSLGGMTRKMIELKEKGNLKEIVIRNDKYE